MLQGTLDVFSLDEVLGLLSGANKSGVLNITGDRGVGSVSIADGQLVAGSASSAPGVAELSDVVFELLRYQEGSFSFDGAASAEGEPHELEAVLTEAHSRLDEWKGIEAVVPSLDHHVSLSATLSTSQVTLSESEWAAVVAIGEGATVGVIARRLDLGEFDGSKRIKSLIERSLASIEESAVQAAPTETIEAPAPVVEAPAPMIEAPAPVFETPEPAPMSFADVAPVASTETDTVSDIATDFSLETDETVAPDAPAFEDSALDAFAAEADIPPMPEAPSFEVDAIDTEIPPMPEPPSTFAAATDASVPPPPAPPAVDDAPSSFAGLDPIGGSDMFEAPLRSGERSTDAFGGEGFDAEALVAETAMDAPMPPPPAPAAERADAETAIPSFAPPAGFDAEAFGSEDAPAAGDDAAETAEESAEKGGSLLMRYLKSNG